MDKIKKVMFELKDKEWQLEEVMELLMDLGITCEASELNDVVKYRVEMEKE